MFSSRPGSPGSTTVRPNHSFFVGKTNEKQEHSFTNFHDTLEFGIIRRYAVPKD